MKTDKVDFKVIKQDETDELSKVLVAIKPIGVTSHDIVDYFRHEFNTEKVGHAGTLDPFATGELIIAIGKYTKNLDGYLSFKKFYTFKAVLGIQTLSGDPDEKITKFDKKYFSDLDKINIDEIEKTLKKKLDKYKQSYSQTVPVLSSVKVSGYKLRELVRKANEIKIIDAKLLKETDTYIRQKADDKNIGTDRKVAQFITFNKTFNVLLPKRECKLYSYENISIEKLKFINIQNNFSIKFLSSINTTIDEVLVLSGKVEVGSGTYIRTLVEDLATDALESYGVLYSLERNYDLSEL